MNWPNTSLTQRLHIAYPIIQAPMAGGVTTPELVAAVSNAGGLGSLGAGYMEPEALHEAIVNIRSLTRRPFAVNLFIPQTVTEDAERIAHANTLLAPFRTELGLEPTEPPEHYLPDFAEQLAVILEHRVPVFSFTFGVPKPDEMETLKEYGIITIGTATHLLEAIVLEESQVDMIVVQGLEAGGHRGTFVGDHEQGLVSTLSLLPLCADHIKTPLIAAGGIMDGRGIAAALALGASGAQMGTAFLACPESGAHTKYKELLRQGTEITTTLTRAFSGRAARALRNRFTEALETIEQDLPDYPIQNALTQDIRQAAAQQDRPEFMSLWAGQGCPLCRDKPAARLVREWADQVMEIQRHR